MAEGRQRAARAPQVAVALAIAVALWAAARAREPGRATVPVRDDDGVFSTGTVRAVVEGPTGSLVALRVRAPALRPGTRSNTGVPVLTPDDIELPTGVRGVRVQEVLVRLPPPP